jgi:hypothetical protein
MFSLDRHDEGVRTILDGERRRQQNLDDGEVLSNVVSYALETRRQMKHYESMYATAQELADTACDWAERMCRVLEDILDNGDLDADPEYVEFVERLISDYFKSMGEA